jgi:urease accessory protein
MDVRLRIALLGGAVLGALNPTAVLAHTGQGADGLWAGTSHPFLGVDHLFAMVTVGVLAVVLRRRVQLPLVFVCSMALGSAVGMSGVSLTHGETAIALSVVALGAALVAGARTHWRFAAAMLALAGLVHGHAHGAEAPSAAHPALYIVGFVVATAALHAAGVVVGYVIRRRPAVRTTVGAVVTGVGLGLVVGLV